jgi:hypothetical protein
MNINAKIIESAKAGFEYKCIFILVDGYRLMTAANQYSLDWEEEQITAQLRDYIERCSSTQEWKIHVVAEPRIYTKEIISGEKLPKQASQIDMQMLSWQSEGKKLYYVETKNLCENDWMKSNGAKVKSSYQLNRYVNKGISHFVSGHYPKNGCMCGYILEGNVGKIVEKLNSVLGKKSLFPLQISSLINDHFEIYNFKYNGKEFPNIFFNFQ